MKVIIRDHNKSIAITKRELNMAVHFFMEKLIKTPKKRENLKITVSFDDSCFPGADPYKYIALCSAFLTKGKKRPTEFLIELNSRLSRTAIIKALAHELVHVRQYSSGELSSTRRGTQWKGKAFDESKIDYYEYPWEIEAFGYEPGLVYWYSLFCKEHGFGNRRRNKRRKTARASSSGHADMATTLGIQSIPELRTPVP